MKFSKTLWCNYIPKKEDLQITRSFKVRGIYNKIISLSKTEKGIKLLGKSHTRIVLAGETIEDAYAVVMKDPSIHKKAFIAGSFQLVIIFNKTNIQNPYCFCSTDSYYDIKKCLLTNVN